MAARLLDNDVDPLNQDIAIYFSLYIIDERGNAMLPKPIFL
jgi:hypothetical protein